MKKNLHKGFTLIELLIVIAIIGVLSGIVMASLNTARDKSANAAVKSNLQGIRSQAEVVADNNSQNYSTICADSNITNAINNAIMRSGDTGDVSTRCNATANAWAVNVMLKIPEGTDTYWCIDNLGTVKGEPAELGGATACA